MIFLHISCLRHAHAISSRLMMIFITLIFATDAAAFHVFFSLFSRCRFDARLFTLAMLCCHATHMRLIMIFIAICCCYADAAGD